MDSFALITGAADRIGKTYALKLADMGYNIFLHYNSSEAKARETQQLVNERGQKCYLKQADFRDDAAIKALIPDCIKQGSLEILINNASYFVESSIETEGHDLYDMMHQINFKAPYILTKQFAKHCGQGHIINLLDTKIAKNHTLHFDYLLTKKALQSFTNISATQLAPNIRVNGIAPGLVLAPEGKTDRYLQKKAKEIPLQHTGSLEQLEQALEFLVQNEFLTGQVIYVDGGEHL